MMDYVTFKKEVENRLIDYMPVEMMGKKVEFIQVDKVNGTLDGIRIGCRNLNSSAMLAPIIYINDMYEIYRKCGDFSAVMSMSLLHMQQAVQTNIDKLLDLSTAKSNIVFQLVNTEQNRKILGNIPSRSFLDLSIIYRWMVQIDESGTKSAIVNNDLARGLGVTEEELFRIAKENTKRIFKTAVMDVGDMLVEPDIVDMVTFENKDLNLLVITNDRFFLGAASVLYEDEIHAIAERLESDLYIIPSSVHEMIVIKTGVSPYYLADMLASINKKEVPIEERLSNQVYRYDKHLKKFSLATDTPNKNLGR